MVLEKKYVSGARIYLGNSCEGPSLQWSFEGNARIKTERRSVAISGRKSINQNTGGSGNGHVYWGWGLRELS